MTWLDLVDIGSKLGIGALLAQFLPWLWRFVTNREGKRRSDADKAWADRDDQARRRRVIEEHAHELRRILIDAPCVERADIPSWPSRGITDKKEENE